jgi:chromosome segregation ATPase
VTWLLALFAHRIAGPIAAGVAFLACAALLWATVTHKAEMRVKDGVIKGQQGQITRLDTDLRACRADLDGAKASLEAQKRALEALKAESDRVRQEAENAVSDALRGRQRAEAKAARLLSINPKGATLLERYEEVDRAVLEALK